MQTHSTAIYTMRGVGIRGKKSLEPSSAGQKKVSRRSVWLQQLPSELEERALDFFKRKLFAYEILM